MAALYIVATPIGNLEDITLRALRVLKEVDYILCEDTRVTKKLLDRYEIQKPLVSYHQHSRLAKLEFIVQLLKEGKNIALVSDAGTPGISDPGGKLIDYLITQLPNYPITITPIPGPSAVTAALSISGVPTDRFLFLGFPPHKKKRKQFFERVVESRETVIFYESPHRIIKTLNQLKETLQTFSLLTLKTKLKTHIVVCRELTKMFETVYRGTIEEVIKQIEADKVKGEFVVIVGK